MVEKLSIFRLCFWVDSVLDAVASVLEIIYYFYDHLVWFHRVGIRTLSDKEHERVDKMSSYFWFANSIFDFLSAFVQLMELRKAPLELTCTSDDHVSHIWCYVGCQATAEEKSVRIAIMTEVPCVFTFVLELFVAVLPSRFGNVSGRKEEGGDRRRSTTKPHGDEADRCSCEAWS